MKQLTIFFKDTELNQFSWHHCVENTLIDSGDQMTGDIAQLAQSVEATVFVLPQHWLYETFIDIADKNSKQLLSAAAFQLEDQLAEDVDELHFAQGNEIGGKVPFVIIKHSIMKDLADFETLHGISASAMISELSLAPSPELKQINVYHHHNRYVFKSDNPALNAVFHESQLDFYVNHFYSDNTKNHLNFIDENDDSFLMSSVDITQCVNLKQKDYATSHLWLSRAKNFSLPIALSLLLGMIVFVNQWQINDQLLAQKELIQQQQQELLKAKVSTYRDEGNAKKTLIKLLQNQQGANGNADFIAMFHRLLKAKQAVKSIQLKKLDYRNNVLKVDVTASNLQLLDQFVTALKGNDFSVSVVRMDLVDNESLGRFVLEAH